MTDNIMTVTSAAALIAWVVVMAKIVVTIALSCWGDVVRAWRELRASLAKGEPKS